MINTTFYLQGEIKMINRTVVNRGINGILIRDCEIQHLIKHNFVISHSGFACVSDKLWGLLMRNEENQKLVKSLEEK